MEEWTRRTKKISGNMTSVLSLARSTGLRARATREKRLFHIQLTRRIVHYAETGNGALDPSREAEEDREENEVGEGEAGIARRNPVTKRARAVCARKTSGHASSHAER